mmetsp:Transcript_95570/g.248876  ORF Transcript_95570/g.248876 Transcript_95570/m.248876 type:complete len:214 (+) Transcript_95570:206-847(+)
MVVQYCHSGMTSKGCSTLEPMSSIPNMKKDMSRDPGAVHNGPSSGYSARGNELHHNHRKRLVNLVYGVYTGVRNIFSHAPSTLWYVVRLRSTSVDAGWSRPPRCGWENTVPLIKESSCRTCNGRLATSWLMILSTMAHSSALSEDQINDSSARSATATAARTSASGMCAPISMWGLQPSSVRWYFSVTGKVRINFSAHCFALSTTAFSLCRPR